MELLYAPVGAGAKDAVHSHRDAGSGEGALDGGDIFSLEVGIGQGEGAGAEKIAGLGADYPIYQ